MKQIVQKLKVKPLNVASQWYLEEGIDIMTLRNKCVVLEFENKIANERE